MAGQDARSLSPEALEVLRRRAVAAVESGVPRSEVARVLGVSRKAVGSWVLAYKRGGDNAFTPRPRGRRPGEQLALTPTQQACTVKKIIAGTPDSHGLPHHLWTRQAVAELVMREYGVMLAHGTIAHYLHRWGLIEEPRPAEMPRRHAEPEAIRVTRTRPRARIDLSRPVGPRRNLLSGFGNYYGDVTVLLAMSNRGVIYFAASDGPFDDVRTADFLRRLDNQIGRSVNVIVCH